MANCVAKTVQNGVAGSRNAEEKERIVGVCCILKK
jgi:hypothetical protein